MTSSPSVSLPAALATCRVSVTAAVMPSLVRLYAHQGTTPTASRSEPPQRAPLNGDQATAAGHMSPMPFCASAQGSTHRL